MENTFQLSVEQSEVFGNIGTAFAMAEVDADQAIEDFARAVDPNNTGSASYEIWEAGMAVVKQAYADKKNVVLDSDTIKSMTKRFYRRLEENYGLTKPASQSADSVKKAEQRAKAEKAKAELMAKPTTELQAEIAMLTASPTKANLAKAGKLAKKCGDREILEQCLELLTANITESTI